MSPWNGLGFLFLFQKLLLSSLKVREHIRLVEKTDILAILDELGLFLALCIPNDSCDIVFFFSANKIPLKIF